MKSRPHTSLPPSRSRTRRGSAALGTAVLLAASSAVALASTEWYVSKGVPCGGAGTQNDPFCRIADALAAAADGDTIHIGRGRYRESLLVDKDVTLIGTEGDDVTFVDATTLRKRVVALTDGTVGSIVGLTLTGGYQYAYPSRGGGGVYLGYSGTPATLTLTDSTVSGNRCDGGDYLGSRGGGIYNGNGTLTLVNTTVADNAAYGASYGSSAGEGGGIYNRSGTVTLINSTVSGNAAASSYAQSTRGGGILSSGGYVRLEDTSVVDNVSSSFYGSFDPPGIGVAAGTLVVDRCTVSGNLSGTRTAAPIVFRGDGMVMTSSIVWGNTGPPGVDATNATVFFSDVEGGWTGPGSHNIDADPSFADPANGDYSLLATSVCIDAGDPADLPSGLGLGGNPRLLDGDLDRVMRVDMGAHELSHVRLAVSGNATPGGTVTVDASGTAGLQALLAVGFPGAETPVPPFGAAFVALGPPTRVIGAGPIPTSNAFPIPPTLGVPLDVVVQALALGAPLPSGRSPGNLSNPVLVTVE